MVGGDALSWSGGGRTWISVVSPLRGCWWPFGEGSTSTVLWCFTIVTSPSVKIGWVIAQQWTIVGRSVTKK